jgi:hypothetical protein
VVGITAILVYFGRDKSVTVKQAVRDLRLAAEKEKDNE